MADLTLKLVLQALDKGASPTVRRFTSVVHGLSREVKAAPAGWTGLTASINKNASATNRATQATRTGGRALDDLIDRQRRLRRETDQTAGAWNRLTSRLRGTPNAALGWLGGAGAGALGGGVGLAATAGAAAGGLAVAGTVGAGKSVIDTGARFESYQAQLKTSNDGDLAKAKADLGWVKTFAKRTPYDIDQVTKAFIMLKAYGIDPTDGSLLALGNAASGMGKDVQAAVEMLADAQTGEFERLKEFGVRAKVQGDKVTFSYRKAGKDIKVVSKNAAGDIQRSLIGIFDARFKGAMDEQSKTWNGMMSTMGDNWIGFQQRVADKGLFDKARGHLAGLLEFIEKAEKDGRLDKWAGQISTSLGEMIDMLARVGKAVDWVDLAKDVATFASAVARLIELLAKLEKYADNPVFRVLSYAAPGGGLKLSGDTSQFLGNGPRNAARGLGDAIVSTRNPWADAWPKAPIAGRNGGGIDGGPRGAAQFKGKMEIGLAPGLVVKQADFGSGVTTDYRRGFVGGRND